MKTYLKIVVILTALLLIGIAIPKLFIKENVQLADRATLCSPDIDPRIAVYTHFDNPLQHLLTFKTIVTHQDENGIHVSGYTLFGVKLTEARVACKDGAIETLK